MKHKFPGTGDFRFHPLRKIAIMFSGVRYAAVHEICFVYELAVSVIVLVPQSRFS